MEQENFAAKVWQTLQAVNVNDKIEKKQGLAYLSWSFAWQTLMTHFPESSYTIHGEKYFQGGTAEVGVSVTVKQGEQSLTRDMWLPVIDHRNKAVENPDSFLINKAKMRCLVKCIAMFGLGLYIYAGEDYPEEPPQPTPKPLDLDKALNALHNAKDLNELQKYFKSAWQRADETQQTALKTEYDKRKADFVAAEQG